MTMKTAIQPRSLLSSCAGVCAVAVILLAARMPGTAQTAPQASQTQTRPGTTPVQQHADTAQTVEVPVTPSAPKPPDWPANNHPTPATVVWNNQGLRIEASNASLDQILHDVATDTGAKIEGLSQDQRIFGNYGPGPARDVLAQLLDGSGYNMLFVGDMGQGTPREIVLSTRPSGAAQPAHVQAKSNDDDDEEPPLPPPAPEEPPPPPPLPVTSPNSGVGPAMPRTPQEIMQEMQQRQQQLQQQSQQIQQQQPPQQQ